jgi:hypothetical protein
VYLNVRGERKERYSKAGEKFMDCAMATAFCSRRTLGLRGSPFVSPPSPTFPRTLIPLRFDCRRFARMATLTGRRDVVRVLQLDYRSPVSRLFSTHGHTIKFSFYSRSIAEAQHAEARRIERANQFPFLRTRERTHKRATRFEQCWKKEEAMPS